MTADRAGEFDERGQLRPACPAQPALQQQPAVCALDRDDLPELFLEQVDPKLRRAPCRPVSFPVLGRRGSPIEMLSASNQPLEWGGEVTKVRALVYGGPGKRSWDEVPDPQVVNPTDAIIRVDAVTICGTDLHILSGDVPEVQAGRVLGHEAVGTVTEVGAAVSTVRPGDRVLASCISACGRCRFCRQARYGQCLGGGGWILGHQIDGVQAELARVPFADLSTYTLPDDVSDEAALILADVLPTAYEVGTLNGQVTPGDTVVIVGAGPIGLAAIWTARLFSPLCVIVVEKADGRLRAATQLGADIVVKPDDVLKVVRSVTDGLGADVVLEAVGVPASFELCLTLVRPGGRVANIGVHGKPATLHLEELWIRDITITTGLVDTYSIPTLLRMVAAGRIDTADMITHRFPLGDIMRAYDAFSQPGQTGTLKVALSRG